MKKILVVPMSAMAETAGPGSRCRILAEGFKDAGMEVCSCMARDVNFIELDGIKNYKLEIPTPMGMPEISAKFFFPLAQKLGITSKKTVKSFDQVLFFTGNLDKRYLRKSVEDIRSAIRDFRPDIVYSEFNISAMIAAKLEHVCLFTTVSFPTQKEYACEPKLAKGLNKLLAELGLPEVSSTLELFEWADKKFCPSIPELEPFEKKVTFIGTLKAAPGKKRLKEAGTTSSEKKEEAGTLQCEKPQFAMQNSRNKILVYMGNGTVPAKKMLREVKEAFKDSSYQIYIASKYLEPEENGNFHVAQKWDFAKLLEDALLFINHGGQNSMVDGLLYGVPQIMAPGKVFERKYNAQSMESAGAGKVLSHDEFCAGNIRKLAEELIESEEARKNVQALGEKLLQGGGVGTIIHIINRPHS